MNPPFEKAADHFAPLIVDQQATDRMMAEAIADLRAGQEEICWINATCSPRVNAASDQLAPDGRLLGTAAPTLDTQGEER